MAGSSAGSLICACNALVPMAEVELACRDLVADMRKHGVYGRLRGTLEGMLQEILPEDAHVRVRVRSRQPSALPCHARNRQSVVVKATGFEHLPHRA